MFLFFFSESRRTAYTTMQIQCLCTASTSNSLLHKPRLCNLINTLYKLVSDRDGTGPLLAGLTKIADSVGKGVRNITGVYTTCNSGSLAHFTWFHIKGIFPHRGSQIAYICKMANCMSSDQKSLVGHVCRVPMQI